MKIVNGTTHTINIFDIKDTTATEDGRKLVLKNGATPVLTIESGTNLNAIKGNADLPAHLVNISSEVPLKGAVEFKSHDPVPTDADIVIVSNLFRSAVKELGGDTSKLATVDGTVYQSINDLRPCGCLGLAVG